MISIPLGKIPVPTPGTPVALSLTGAQAALLPPSGLVQKIEAWADPADTGVVHIKQAGTKIATLPVPANGHAEHWHAGGGDCAGINPLAFSVDAAVATNGPFVTLWVE